MCCIDIENYHSEDLEASLFRFVPKNQYLGKVPRVQTNKNFQKDK